MKIFETFKQTQTQTNKECGTEKGQQVDVSIELLFTQTWNTLNEDMLESISLLDLK